LVGAKHYRDYPFFRRGDGDRRTGGYVFLVEAFVEPDLVFARGLLGVGFDDLLVVPFGAGFSGAWHGLVLEGRFTYRSTFTDDLLKNADGSNVNLANWSVGGLIGYEF